MKYAFLITLALILAFNTDMQVTGVWDIFDLGFIILLFSSLAIWATGADNA